MATVKTHAATAGIFAKTSVIYTKTGAIYAQIDAMSVTTAATFGLIAAICIEI